MQKAHQPAPSNYGAQAQGESPGAGAGALPGGTIPHRGDRDSNQRRGQQGVEIVRHYCVCSFSTPVAVKIASVLRSPANRKSVVPYSRRRPSRNGVAWPSRCASR